MKMLKILQPKIYFYAAGFLTASVLFFILGSSHFAGPAAGEAGAPQSRISQPEVPLDITFAGEKVPLENFEIYERMDREVLVNTFWHSFTILSIKRANRWFPVIEPILKKNGIPDDFKYLAVIESGLANAVSPAGATGFWQITEDAGTENGMEINSEVDERYDVEKSTEFACKYLKEARSRFGSWTLAAASYNMGMNGVRRQEARQKADSYYNMTLSEETSRYLFRILSMKAIMNNREKYGYYLEQNDLYPPLSTYEVKISGKVNNLADFAIDKGLSYKILKYYNPWLRDTALTNQQGKIYAVKLPVKGALERIHD